MKSFDLEGYLSSGVEQVIAGIMKATAKNPKDTVFARQPESEPYPARTCGQRGTHSTVSDCQHYHAVQPALPGLLCAGESQLSGWD